jgi:hypothetical protein
MLFIYRVIKNLPVFSKASGASTSSRNGDPCHGNHCKNSRGNNTITVTTLPPIIETPAPPKPNQRGKLLLWQKTFNHQAEHFQSGNN